jgi:hypothetical protein
MKIFLAVSIIICICAFVICEKTFAQPKSHWTQINLPSANNFVDLCPYFLNENIGFIYSPRARTTMFRTTNGGVTWKNVLQDSIYIFNVSFCSISHGFFASSNGLYETTDTGISWHILDSNKCISVYANPSKVFIIRSPLLSFSQTLLSKSYDKIEFDSLLTLNALTVVGNKDSFIAVVNYETDSIWYSNDNGINWNANDIANSLPDIRHNNKTQLGVFEGIFCFPYCNDLLITYLADRIDGEDNDVYTIAYSSDFGKTWKKNYKQEIGAWIAGSKCHQYVSCAPDSTRPLKTGTLRSDDRGKKWKFTQGTYFLELDDVDFHNLSVVGHGAIVYAVTSIIGFDDPLGNPTTLPATLWVTHDGGDGILSPNQPLVQFQAPKSISVGVCDSVTFKFTVENICEFIRLNKYKISGLDSDEYQLSSIHSYQCGDYKGTFTIKVKPKNFTPRPVNFNFNFTDDEYNTFDTSLSIDLNIHSSPLYFTGSPNSISLGTISTCSSPIDTIITLLNKGCDTLIITDTSGINTSQFKLLSPFKLPIKISPGDSIVLTFRFTPTGTGNFRIYPIFHAEQQGLSADVQLYLEGNGKSEGGVLSYFPKQFNFNSLSICDHDSASGYITNIGCDSININPAQILGDQDFNVLGLSNSLPIIIRSKDTVRYKVYLNPLRKGVRQGMIVLNSVGTTKNDSIPFTCIIHDGTKILSASANEFDFGVISVCDNRDTIIHLTNSGCDTITIDNITGFNSGFGTNHKFPIILLPNHDTTLNIFTLLDTLGGNSYSSATLTVISDADSMSPIKPITLSRSYSLGNRINLGFYLDSIVRSGGDQSVVIYDFKAINSFSNSGIDSLVFTLDYNTDLLDFDKVHSKNVSFDGKNFIIHPISVDSNGVLASIAFLVYLTKDSTTQIIMTNASYTRSIPCGILSISGIGIAQFDYRFLCGERTIQNFMNGILPLKIGYIRPNPAQDEILVSIEGHPESLQQFSIYDVMGREVYTAMQKIVSSEPIHIDIKNLSVGTFQLRVGNSTEHFIKLR